MYPSGKHYDAMLKHSRRDILDDIDFYIDKAKKYNCKSVLELGCGTGRIAIPLKEAGFDVVGIDLMTLMLQEARKKALQKNLKIPFIQGDVRNFSLIQKFGKFDLILGPAALFQALLTNSDFEQMLTCVRNHLKSKSKFIFHMFNPNLKILTKDPNEVNLRWEYPDPEGRGTMKVYQSSSYETTTQISTTKFYYKIEDQVLYQRELKLKMYFPCELDLLLRYNGFNLEHKFADFKEIPFHSESMTQIVLCKKI